MIDTIPNSFRCLLVSEFANTRLLDILKEINLINLYGLSVNNTFSMTL